MCSFATGLRNILIISAITVLGFLKSADAQTTTIPQTKTPSASGAVVYIISPKDGDTVTSPVLVQFGLKKMGVAPAGVDVGNTGHHHLLIDMSSLPDLNAPLPATDQIKHFGGGQTEAEIALTPGRHTLQLLLADKSHLSFEPPVVSVPITVTVK